MRHSHESSLKIEYLREYEFCLKQLYPMNQGTQGYCLPKKTSVENFVILFFSISFSGVAIISLLETKSHRSGYI
jgi:hypothetical protein